MLKISLLELDRGPVRLREQISPDSPFWEGVQIRIVEPLEVELAGEAVGEGVLVRGTLHTAVELECRRCLTAVVTEIDREVGLWFEEATGEEEEGDEIYLLPSRGTELDLREPIREQVVLNAPTYALCDEACRGLCPTCGADRNRDPCECEPPAECSPWGALKTIEWD